MNSYYGLIRLVKFERLFVLNASYAVIVPHSVIIEQNELTNHALGALWMHGWAITLSTYHD